MLKEIVFHGRGGQGAVTAANILASAALKDGHKDVQAFPFFGAERRGAPVRAFARISDEEINLRSQIKEPDIVVVLDTGLMDVIDVDSGIKKDGLIIINTNMPPSHFNFRCKVATVDATSIAIEENLMVSGIPVVNTPMVGALAKFLGISIEAVKEAIKERWHGEAGEKNARGAEIAYNMVRT
ncbi:MAG: 2-oxoacid:acceptor oxidoreductase family protein [Thermoplasmata archaeon]|nr:2-oxoacid:acceptor oxidoreductase family protein [Thermoplasmata archaeon]